MRNKKLILNFNFLKYLIILMIICEASFANKINLSADNIQTSGENIIKASQNIKIQGQNGLTIYADNLEGDNSKEIYTIENNISINDPLNNITINSNKIIFDRKKNLITSLGLTEIESINNFLINTSDITFDRSNKIIFTKNQSEIKDNNFNKLILNEFFVSLNENFIRSDFGVLIDKELNEFEINNIYYNFSKKEMLGRDIELNSDNKNKIKKEYLPRMKGKTFFYDKDYTIVNKTVYTNCQKRDGCPPWLLKAKEINHDKKKKTVNYKDAWLNIYDVPVIYFPKFFHPDPTVKRQSGFLTPAFVTSNNLGNYFKVPYFFAISENRDFTFSPRIYDNNKAVYQGEYRHLTKNSENIIDASIKNDNFLLLDDNSTNSHFFLDSSINLKNNFFDFSELNIQVQSTSSDNYLKSYNLKSPLINSNTTLNSKILFEGVTEKSDLTISGEIYEDLTKKNESDRYEYIFPNFNLSRNIETNLNGNLEFNHSGYNKIYKTNIRENVLINDMNYKSNDKIFKNGIISNYELLIKNFNVESNNSKKYNNNFDSDLGGIFQFYTKLPLEKKGLRFNSTLTPIFITKLSPENTRNVRGNDDMVEYNKIYSINRIGSNETVEGGKSITLGNEFTIFDKTKDINEIFSLNLATSLREEKNESLSDKSSLGNKTSNIIGEMKLSTNKFYELNYNFLSDNNIGEFNYHKIISKFKINNFVSSFEFLEQNNLIGNESYLANETSFKLDENKDLIFKTRKNKKTDLTEYYNLIYQYKMDCLVAGIEYKKDYYSDVGVKPSEKLFFSITIMPFKNSLDLPGINK